MTVPGEEEEEEEEEKETAMATATVVAMADESMPLAGAQDFEQDRAEGPLGPGALMGESLGTEEEVDIEAEDEVPEMQAPVLEEPAFPVGAQELEESKEPPEEPSPNTQEDMLLSPELPARETEAQSPSPPAHGPGNPAASLVGGRWGVMQTTGSRLCHQSQPRISGRASADPCPGLTGGSLLNTSMPKGYSSTHVSLRCPHMCTQWGAHSQCSARSVGS